ncbi:aldo/keto reductase [Georgenia alba]|uniref:Aldo/keto reductase n=1 Tax=Georgenia alba TaxID=2233858 RepID=A0ABW2Q8X2_9MICO
MTDRVRLTRWGFGAAELGNLYETVAPDAARAAVDAAWEAGIRYFDTAPHYGIGLSERRLGDALTGRAREEYVLSTKVGRILEPDPGYREGDLDPGGFVVPATLRRRADLSPAGIERSLTDSLERLGLDAVDVAYLHDPEETARTTEEMLGALETLVTLRDSGVVRAVGAGSKDPEILRAAVTRSDLDLVMLAGRHTLLEQSADPLLGTCLEHGVGVVAVGVFNSGILADPAPGAGARYEYAAAPPDVLDRAQRLAAVCRRHGLSLPHVAVHFPLRHPAVVDVTIGMRSAAEVRDLARWAAEPVPEAVWADLAAEGLLGAADPAVAP